MTPEGMRLDTKGLKLLRDLAELNRQIAYAKTLGSSGEKRCTELIARRVLTRREARSHCEQAGLSWEKFRARLKRSKDA